MMRMWLLPTKRSERLVRCVRLTTQAVDVLPFTAHCLGEFVEDARAVLHHAVNRCAVDSKTLDRDGVNR